MSMGVLNSPSITATRGSPDKKTLNKFFLIVKYNNLAVIHPDTSRLQQKFEHLMCT